MLNMTLVRNRKYDTTIYEFFCDESVGVYSDSFKGIFSNI